MRLFFDINQVQDQEESQFAILLNQNQEQC